VGVANSWRRTGGGGGLGCSLAGFSQTQGISFLALSP